MWSALYDGDSPDPETFLQSLPEESCEGSSYPEARLPQQNTRTAGRVKDKNQSELEWDDSYDTGISSGADVGSPGPYDDVETPAPPAPVDPPKHIQEMKKNAILLFKGSYIEESDFQDDVMVYRLCAEKDSEDTREPQGVTADLPAETQPKTQPEEAQSPPVSNGPLFCPDPEAELQPSPESSDLCQGAFSEATQECDADAGLDSNSESIVPTSEAEVQSDLPAANTESDIIAQYDQIIQELGSGPEGLMGQTIAMSDPLLLTNQDERREESREEEEDDFDSLMAATPAVETVPSPFGVREDMALPGRHPVRTQSAPFTGDNLKLLCGFSLCCGKKKVRRVRHVCLSGRNEVSLQGVGGSLV